MKLIIGNMNPKMRDFIKVNQFKDKILVISKMCNVKTIKETVEVIIPFGIIEPNGLISNTMVHLEELLMSVDVTCIKYGSSRNFAMLNKISKTYNVKIEYLNLNNNLRVFY